MTLVNVEFHKVVYFLLKINCHISVIICPVCETTFEYKLMYCSDGDDMSSSQAWLVHSGSRSTLGRPRLDATKSVNLRHCYTRTRYAP